MAPQESAAISNAPRELRDPSFLSKLGFLVICMAAMAAIWVSVVGRLPSLMVFPVMISTFFVQFGLNGRTLQKETACASEELSELVGNVATKANCLVRTVVIVDNDEGVRYPILGLMPGGHLEVFKKSLETYDEMELEFMVGSELARVNTQPRMQLLDGLAMLASIIFLALIDKTHNWLWITPLLLGGGYLLSSQIANGNKRNYARDKWSAENTSGYPAALSALTKFVAEEPRFWFANLAPTRKRIENLRALMAG